jgi:large subunit ribosomal protein L3
MYDPETGKRTPCTVLQMDRVQVVAHKTRQKNGYWAVQIGAGWKHPSNVTRPLLGHFAGAGVSPKRHMAEFRVKDEQGLLPLGVSIGPEWFVEGQFVDARANCRGMGFEGGMKRHNFKGQGASHGNSLAHRVMGSSGGSQGSGSRVHPGKRMPGNMGGQQVTVQNVKVLKVDTEKGIVVLNGCIAGPDGCVVKIQDAIKKPWPANAPTSLPVGLPEVAAQAAVEASA